MFKQVRANLYFTTEDEGRDFYHDCQLALAKSSVINPGQPDEEFSHIQLLTNNHDQDPNQFCDLEASADNKPEQ